MGMTGRVCLPLIVLQKMYDHIYCVRGWSAVCVDVTRVVERCQKAFIE